MTTQQQNELDKIEEKILIILFGSVKIPESTAIALRLANINPNVYINKLESLLQPVMLDDGKIDGSMLKKLVSVTKYRDILSVLTIPDCQFFLSEIVNSLIYSLIPGVMKNV